MSLVSAGEGWTINRISRGGPYRVEAIGPYKFPQVVDASGTVALSGPDGAVFQTSFEQAEALCAAANAGALESV